MTSPRLQRQGTHRTNEQWLAELQVGHSRREIALADLRQRLIKGLGYALRDYLSPADPNYDALVEESVQEAMIKILDSLDTFQGRSRFITWAQKIGVHTALTELRRKRWRDTSLDTLVQNEEDAPASHLMADPADNPEQTALQADLLRRVQKVIAEDLTDRQRIAMVGTRIRNLPFEQVAQEMDIRPNALYKLLHDARLRLKKHLEAEGLTPEEILAAFDA